MSDAEGLQLSVEKLPDEASGDLAASAAVLPPTEASDRRIVAYQIHRGAPAIRPGRPHRQWMEETPERFAYRCLPLVMANQLGWDLINPTSMRARWFGGRDPVDVQVEALGRGDCGASGHFGSGVLTFSVGYVFRTPPGVGLLVAGPPNLPKDGVHPLWGFVETDWNHTSFTMNYLFTRPNHWVEFLAGESFCRLLPVSLELVESLRAVQTPLDSAPELAGQYQAWSAERDTFNRQLQSPWSRQASAGWQKEYFQGRRFDGKRTDGHRTQVHLTQFSEDAAEVKGKTSAPRKHPAQPVVEPDAHRFLWTNTDCFHDRQQKHAEVLIGMANALRRNRPLDGAEQVFLDSFERFARFDSTCVTDVLLEPRAYFWTRMAFALADACMNGAPLTPLASDYRAAIGGGGPADVLQRHLDSFRLFELAAVISAETDCRFDPPLSVNLPLAIPASDALLDGSGAVDILGYEAGQLELSIDGQQERISPGSEGDRCGLSSRTAVVDFDGWRVRLQPHALGGLGLPSAEVAVEAGVAYHRRHVDLMHEASACVQRHAPHCFEQLSGTTRIIGLKPPGRGEYTNVSFSELPGAMLLSVIEQPYVMADRIIHEFHHDRLFHIEDSGPLLSAETPEDAAFYSPWREDPRPLRGVLHGMYVYIAVARYWLDVWRAGAAASIHRDFVADQSRRTLLQIRIAEAVLAEHAVFTPPGEGLFLQLREDIQTLDREMAEAGVPYDVAAYEATNEGLFERQQSAISGEPLTVCEAVEEHRRRFERSPNATQ